MIPNLSIRNWISLALTVLSLAFLYPGLTTPVLTLDISLDLLFTRSTVMHETQSVVSSIESLFENKNGFVAFLILLFSIVVPISKAMLMLCLFLIKALRPRAEILHKVVYIIGKWSMADVFVIAILIAFMAIRANENVHATLHNGFYYFLSYCLISLAAISVADFKSLEK
ncbi:MAG: paraquat-inducible protein A [Bacteroidia bacterium]|nr:paraquat-inducible protein A [Bacteroidia bacterium]